MDLGDCIAESRVRQFSLTHPAVEVTGFEDAAHCVTMTLSDTDVQCRAFVRATEHTFEQRGADSPFALAVI